MAFGSRDARTCRLESHWTPDSLVRFALCSPTYLCTTVDSVLKPLAGGRDLLYDAFRYHALPPDQRSGSGCQDRPRGPPLGVLRDGDPGVSFDFLSQGWTCHFDADYEDDGVDVVASLESVPADARYIFAGARNPEGQVVLGAVGRRDEVTRQTPFENNCSPVLHEDNGVFWYFAHSDNEDGDAVGSFGFSRVSQVKLFSADVFVDDANSDDRHYRLSWHLSGSGYRAGSEEQVEDGLHGWRKLLYYI